MSDMALEAPDRSATRKFNPGMLQSDEELTGQFVVREHELRVVLDVLRGNIDSPSCQHVLLVAPRGRGKTMLLARVATALRTDEALSGHLLPVRFMEESQEIFDIADFWLEALFFLIRECARLDPEMARELRATHDDLATRRHADAIKDHVRSTVLEAADRLGRKLVLMIENLQSLCDDVEDDFGWKLRETLQSEPQIVLLGTATNRFEGLDDAAQPFFELFRIVDLTPLTTGECWRLWRAVSGNAADRRDIRPIEILTGGSPRLLVIVAGLARHRSRLQLLEELVGLIDDHTEYFRGHLDVIPKTERRVYLAVLDLWQPSSSGEVAARSRLDIRTVSTMLGRLVARGAVVPVGSGRKRRYAAAERLLSIYYKLRREREEAAVVHNLVRFMGAFYGEADLAELASELSAEAARTPAVRDGIRQMMEGQISEPGAVTAVCGNLLDLAGNGDVPEPHTPVAIMLLTKAATQGKLGQFEESIAACDELVRRFGDSDIPDVRGLVAAALVCKSERQVETGCALQALQTCEELDRRLDALSGLQKPALEWQAGWLRTQAHLARGERSAAMDALRSAYAAFPAGDEKMMRRMLAGIPDLIAAGTAERDLAEILSSDPEKSDGLLPLVVALRERIGEEVRAPIEVIEVASDIRECIATRLDAGTATAPGETPA